MFKKIGWFLMGTSAALSATHANAAPIPININGDQPLWGDTHLHTTYSFDAYMLGNLSVDPDAAYRFARGYPVLHPRSGQRVQLRRPLDFLVVADHAELMGISRGIGLDDKRLTNSSTGQTLHSLLSAGRFRDAFDEILKVFFSDEGRKAINRPSVSTEAWSAIVESADRNNDPGKFSAIIGWEWSSQVGKDGLANLHRVIFTSASGSKMKVIRPFSANDSADPEDLWAWLGDTSAEYGVEFVAIPHNPNVSDGKMFAAVTSSGQPIGRRYAETRAKWEPVVEVTQMKGDSETHPLISPNDEFAAFEFFPSLLGGSRKAGAGPGDYVRSGLKTGLEIEGRVGVNPFKFGLIGSTDAHTGLSATNEAAYSGKTPLDFLPTERGEQFGNMAATGWDISASGRAAVWAKDNTRESILAAFRRREVYGTTGPRILLRFFGGFGFVAGDGKASDLAGVGYEKGVPMGGDLAHAPRGKAPSFLIHAVKDPIDGNLDRIQIVKGWLDKNGKSHEKIFNVSWSGNRRIGVDGRLPAVGNTVDVKTARFTNTIGSPQLATVWSDPEFNKDHHSFYYVRVLQIPTPRNSLYDAIALGIDPKKTGHPATIQERAYSSPIWYTPK